MKSQKASEEISPLKLFHLMAILFFGTFFLVLSLFAYSKTPQYPFLKFVSQALFYLFAAAYYFLLISFGTYYLSEVINNVQSHKKGYLICAGVLFAIGTFIGVYYYYGLKGIVAQIAVIVVGVITKWISSLIFKKK